MTLRLVLVALLPVQLVTLRQTFVRLLLPCAAVVSMLGLSPINVPV
jgi:hypothetical protein